MADITFNPVAGVPFSGPILMKDCTGAGGPYAPLSMGIAGYIPLMSLSAVTAIGAGTVLDNQGVRNNHSLTVITTTPITGGTLQLQGSQDNTNWFLLVASGALVANSTINVTANLTPVRYLRANVNATITGGGTVTAWVASAG